MKRALIGAAALAFLVSGCASPPGGPASLHGTVNSASCGVKDVGTAIAAGGKDIADTNLPLIKWGIPIVSAGGMAIEIIGSIITIVFGHSCTAQT